MKKIKPLVLVLSISAVICLTQSCKKDSEPKPDSVQTLIDEGSTPKELYDSGTPLDSLYGKTYEGGLIFYLNTTTGDGMVVAESDQSTSAVWGCSGTTTSASGTAIGTGSGNTSSILSNCTTSGIAAKLCDDLVLNNKSDWFLPSKFEVYAMFNNLYANGYVGFNGGYYWTSSENGATQVHAFRFSPANFTYHIKDNTLSVRAVREFSYVN